MSSSGARPPRDILLVIDDPAERDSLAGELQASGFTVDATSAFADAKTELRDHPPRVLVADVRLGAYNGLYLALIAQDTPVSGVVLLDLAYAASLESQARQMGATYLVKPVENLEGLVAAMMPSDRGGPEDLDAS